MSTLLRHHESLSQLHKDVGCDVSYDNCAVRNTPAEYGTMPWRIIIDQANAAAESSGRFLTKRIDSNRFIQNKSANRFELRIGMLY